MKRILIDEGEMYIILVFMVSVLENLKNSETVDWKSSRARYLEKYQQYLRKTFYGLLAFLGFSATGLIAYDVITGSNKVGEFADKLTRHSYHPPVPDKVDNYSIGEFNIKVISNPEGTVVHWWGQETQQVHGASFAHDGKFLQTHYSLNPYNANGALFANKTFAWEEIPIPLLETLPKGLDPHLIHEIENIERKMSPEKDGESANMGTGL